MSCDLCRKEPCICIDACKPSRSLKLRLKMMGIEDPKALVQKFIDRGKASRVDGKGKTVISENKVINLNAEISKLLQG